MRPKLVRMLVTHSLALILGLVGAKLLTGPSSVDPDSAKVSKLERNHQSSRQSKEVHLSSPAAFRAAYSDLVARSMTRQERGECMGDLWRQWGDSDPAGLLAFLEAKRVWPENFKIYTGYGLSSRPDLLLDFALRYGSSAALGNLDDGELFTAASLLAALPEDQKGSEVMSLVRDIDRQLGRSGIETSDPTAAYQRGVAEVLLEEGRLHEFFIAFEGVEDPAERKELAEMLGESLAEDPLSEEVLAQLGRLPEPLQKEAAFKLMGQASSVAMEFPEVREERRRWVERFAEAGWFDAAASGVYDLFRDDEAASRGEEWAAWIERLPNDESWGPITEALFLQWSRADHEEMVRQICALPDEAIREEMANGAAAVTIGGLAQPFDEDDQWIFDSLVALHTDPETRGRFEARFGPTGDPFGANDLSDDGDPFAPSDDPFADDGE